MCGAKKLAWRNSLGAGIWDSEARAGMVVGECLGLGCVCWLWVRLVVVQSKARRFGSLLVLWSWHLRDWVVVTGCVEVRHGRFIWAMCLGSGSIVFSLLCATGEVR